MTISCTEPQVMSPNVQMKRKTADPHIGEAGTCKYLCFLNEINHLLIFLFTND